ncbi:MAG: NADH-quinone oxidoreductase subunit N [Pseudomonadota bacterium]
MLALLQNPDLHWNGLRLLSPELTLVATSLLVLMMDLVWKERDSWRLGAISVVGLVLATIQLVVAHGNEAETAFGLVRVDDFAGFFKLFTCASLIVTTVFVMLDRREKKHRIGEYYFLLLGAGIGIFFMVGTNNLLLLVLGLELLSLSSYSLAGFHKGERRSAEAAMKYVVFGGLSAGILVYGISLLYGATGTLDLGIMSGAVAAGEYERSLATAIEQSPGMVAIAMVLILGGFSYKVSVAPFHFWAPDVYEGAPMPVTTFLAVASKAGGFGALIRFLGVLFVEGEGGGISEAVRGYGLNVGQLIALLAAVTMTLGNLAALRQESVKRMLAYSSIAHAGYLLVGVAAMTQQGYEAALFYLAAYYFMNLGAFGFLLYFSGITGKETYASLRGMGRKAPLMAVPMVVFLVSLTGLPPTVGFPAKYALFQAALDAKDTAGIELGWLALCLALNSVVSLYYYLRVVKELFLAETDEPAPAPQNSLAGILVTLAVLTALFGLWFEPLTTWAKESMDFLATTN